MANNTGVFFNINDNDGIPLVGVSTDGRVILELEPQFQEQS
jgi:hypothetical protein